jgi:hypothetical protein
MATATTTKPRKSTKPKPADTARLTLTIRGVDYTVRPLAMEDQGFAVTRAFRLVKVEPNREGVRESHDVATTIHGHTCDCGDQIWRHEGTDGIGCKHIRAARAFGLL